MKAPNFILRKITHYKEYQEIDLIYGNGEVSKIYEYFYVNEPKNWQISFSFNHYANCLETLCSKIDINTTSDHFTENMSIMTRELFM